MRCIYESDFVSEKQIGIVVEELLKYLHVGDVVLLSGNLGAGKTTLIKSICESWNIPEVSSPTFNLVNEYNGDNKVYHFDFYRVENPDELTDIGFNEYLSDMQSYIMIEWGEKFGRLLPSKRKEVKIVFSEDNLSRKYFLYDNE